MSQDQKPAVIEGNYTVTAVDGRPTKQPIIRSWWGLVAFVAFIALRAIWSWALHSHQPPPIDYSYQPITAPAAPAAASVAKSQTGQ